jgi:tRNA modification GTPase
VPAHSSNDTIVALASPAGTSAIAVLRISGPLCAEFSRSLFGFNLRPRFAHVVRHREIGSNRILDTVVATYYQAPASYTGEEVIEISCHGNPFIVRRLIDDFCARGCRLAHPGEFTQRAFLGGKLDLSQAEAVMDVIRARSERALAAAQEQLDGVLGRHLAKLNNELLDALARVEAYIDFPDEDLPAEDREMVRSAIDRVLGGTRRLLATQRYGEILRQGIRTVIIGAPNAGKSSLLNRIVGYERAIVSAEPGTTRDFIEENFLAGGHSVRLIDTAGLNPAPGEIERMGIEKTLERARIADLLLWVIDLSCPSPALPSEIFAMTNLPAILVVGNKADLVSAEQARMTLSIDGLEKSGLPSSLASQVRTLAVSAQTGDGVPDLIAAIEGAAEGFQNQAGDEIIAVNARHAHALERAKVSLETAFHLLRREAHPPSPPELISSDLREALEALGEIQGKFDNERMLDRLFSTFCIGK